jgi:hypothetical protein
VLSDEPPKYLFAMFLFCRIVRYVTGETTMKEGTDLSVPPEKTLVEQEKELLDKYKVAHYSSRLVVSIGTEGSA